MIRLFLCVAMLAVGPFAMAKTNEPLEQLISLEDFSRLELHDKTLYIKNLQELLVSLNDQQNPQSTVDNNNLLRELLLPPAFAETVRGNEVGGPCIFAGNILKFAANGLCPRPPRGSCYSGQIQCNPLVFGDGVCTAPNSRATGNCLRQAKSIKDIVSYAESHKEEWTDLSQTLDSYCSETGTQGYPCRVIQMRLSQMRKMVEHADKPAAAPAPVVKHVEKTPTPRVRPPLQLHREVAGPGDDQPPRPPADIPNVAKHPAPVKPEVVKKEAPLQGKPASSCDLQLLSEIVTCRSGSDPWTLMLYPQAYETFCKSRKFSKEFDADVKKRFKETTSCLSNVISTSKSAVSIANAKFGLSYMTKVIMPNYERCTSDLQSKSLPPIKTAGKMYIEYRNVEVEKGVKRSLPYAVAQKNNGPREEMGHMYTLSRNLRAKKYGLCDYTLVPPAATKESAAGRKGSQ